jgi:RNA polymerase sigma-70 factor (ECF subfamily)
MDDDERLLAGARRADRSILGEIYDLYSPEIFRYAWRLTGNEDIAEECVADIFSRFLKSLHKGNGPQKYLRAYLYRIAHNWIHDYWLKCKKHVDLEDMDSLSIKQGNLEDSYVSQQDMNMIHTALNQLTSDQQSVIVLKYLEELDNLEIAAILRKPVGAVKSLQHRGLITLHRLLAKHYVPKLRDEPSSSSQIKSSLT